MHLLLQTTLLNAKLFTFYSYQSVTQKKDPEYRLIKMSQIIKTSFISRENRDVNSNLFSVEKVITIQEKEKLRFFSSKKFFEIFL